MDRRLIGILAIIAAVFIGIAVFAGGSKNNNSGQSSKNSNSQTTNHVEGSGKTGVKLVEYGDYQCPVCELYYPTVKEVAAKYNSQIYFQFSNLPLIAIHPNAYAAARAAEAASLQNKFWQMHDLLYDNQQTWATASNPVSYFNPYAQQLGLDTNRFKQDYASSQVNNFILADLNAFKKTNQD